MFNGANLHMNQNYKLLGQIQSYPNNNSNVYDQCIE